MNFSSTTQTQQQEGISINTLLICCRGSTGTFIGHPRDTSSAVCDENLPSEPPFDTPPPYQRTPLPLPPKHNQLHRLITSHREISISYLSSRECRTCTRLERCQ